MLAFTLLGNLLMAMFLLHKSTVTTISKLEIVHIWNKVDTGRSGQLGQDGVGQVRTAPRWPRSWANCSLL
jgi:hypothetical protein